MTEQECYRIFASRYASTERRPDDQWTQLADAIVAKAVEDYRKALKGKGHHKKPAAAIVAECERFFRSQWFTTLSPLDGEVVIQKISTSCEKDRRMHK